MIANHVVVNLINWVHACVCEPDIVASSREVFSTTLVRADEPSKEPAHRHTHARTCTTSKPHAPAFHSGL